MAINADPHRRLVIADRGVNGQPPQLVQILVVSGGGTPRNAASWRVVNGSNPYAVVVSSNLGIVPIGTKYTNADQTLIQLITTTTSIQSLRHIMSYL